ncbi:MAG: putative porin, partial [Melioribacteraceae bacterium]
FQNARFGFINDFGSIGYPNELFIYGNGNGNLSSLADGVSINNRLSNSPGLNQFQSESIGSIEIIPSVRGFLFSNMNNSASVNLISRDPDPRKPYSRLRYYQGSNSEALLDGIFSFNPFDRLNANLEISNHSSEPNFINSDFSNWSGTARLRYLLSKKINIIASYRYSKSVIQLNGGVDVDSIRNGFDSSEFNDILYDRLRAPVNYPHRYQKSAVNDLRLRLLADLSDNSISDLTFYYQSNLLEFRQNEESEVSESVIKKIIDNNSDKTAGFNFSQKLKFNFAEVNSYTNFERSTFNSPLLDEETLKSSFSQTVAASLNLLGELIRPALFGKFLRYSGENYYGFGADASVRFSELFILYAGASSYEKPRSIWEERFILPELKPGGEKTSSLELSVSYNDNSTDASIGYFYRSTANALLSTTYTDYPAAERSHFFKAGDVTLSGMNFNVNFKFWKILLSSNTSIYLPGNRKDFKLPDYSSNGGIYYVDSLFDNNLHLKAGLNYYSLGERDYINFDFERNISSAYYHNPAVTASSILNFPLSSSFQIDFFLAGTIQERATVYFVFENLLDAQYYIIPHYPNQPRGIRFGISWEFLD